jgi:hypothetical protein
MPSWSTVVASLRAPWRRGSDTGMDVDMDAEDIDNLRAWSISAQLAAVPQAYESQVPPEVAALIRAARELHPQMASGARDRDSRGEPCPPLG